MLVSGGLPNKSNVSEQILLKQQLSAHYRRLQCVKASVDTSVPYSFSSNPTTRGYRAQKRISAKNSVLYEFSDEKDADFKMPTKFSDDQTVDCIVKEFLKNNPIFTNVASEEQNLPEDVTPKAKLSSRFNRSIVGSAQLSHAARPGSSSGGDVLELHQHKFTSEKPFSPRTVKTNAESKLRRLRCYNPPIKATRIVYSGKCESENRSVRRASTDEAKESSTANLSRPNSALLLRSVSRTFQPVLFRHSRSSIQFASGPRRQLSTPSPTRLVNRVPSSKSRQTPVRSKPVVPPLPATKLTAEEDDVKENASGAPPIGKVNRWLKTLPDSENSFHITDSVEDSYSFSPDSHATPHPDGQVTSESEQRAANAGAPQPVNPDPNESNIGYLNFIEAVTNDILSRGVFTDTNMNWLLLEHTSRNEYGLTEEQLQQATDQLRRQLKISEDPPPSTMNRLSSGSFTTGATSTDLLLQVPISQSGEQGTETGGSVKSSGTTVPAKLVLTSMRPPPAPSRTGLGSSPTTHRFCSSAGNRVSHQKKTGSAEPPPNVESDEDGEQAEQNGSRESGNRSRIPTLKFARNRTSLTVPEPSGLLALSSEKLTPSSLVDGSTDLTESLAQDNSTEYNQQVNCGTADREDTLNDQVTIPNSSDFPEASSPETCTGTPVSDFLTDDGLGSEQTSQPHVSLNSHSPHPTDPNTEPDPDQIAARPTRVKFAPEPEIISVKPTDLSIGTTTAGSTLTDLSQISSGEAQLSSQQDAEPDLSSAQAIAEGDSNISFEINTQKDCSPMAYADEILPYRAKV